VELIPHLLAAKPMNATLDAAACQGDKSIPMTTPQSKPKRRPNQPTTVVSSIRLDDLPQLWHQKNKVFLWHIDVEGAEVLVLRSAYELLKAGRVQAIMVELLFKNWASFGLTFEDGLAELRHTFEGWSCIVGCSGVEYSWNTTDLGQCTQRGSRFSREGPVMVSPDIFCRAPASSIKAQGAPSRPQFSPPSRI